MRKDYRPFLWALYSASIVAMNVLASKQIDIFNLTVTCGIFVSGLVFYAQDIITELYGATEGKKMAMSCYGISFLMTLLYQIAIIVPSSQFWGMQEAFENILRTTLRITFASFIAYSCGSIVNISIMGALKRKYPKSLFIRAIGSTIAGQLLDNGLFSVIAFSGVLPLSAILSMTVGGTLVEVITELLLYPVLKPTLKLLKRGD